MTAEELKQRGYCCGLGCKECPYVPKHQYANTVLADTFQKESKFNKLYNLLLEKTKEKSPKGVCWKGYKMVGMKKKGKKEVPNCVPNK
jgi:hypothetical protein